MKTHTKMERIMEAYATKKAVQAREIRFLYDGHRLANNDTPTSLDMEVPSLCCIPGAAVRCFS